VQGRRASAAAEPGATTLSVRELLRRSGREALDRHGKVAWAAQHCVGTVRRRVLDEPGELDPAEQFGHRQMEFYWAFSSELAGTDPNLGFR
jgi:hypothetical protein